MQLEQNIAYLRKLADVAGSDNATKLERIIRLLDAVRINPDSPSEQANRMEEAAKRLRDLQGLDADDHNEICLMAELFDQEKGELIKLSNSVGY